MSLIIFYFELLLIGIFLIRERESLKVPIAGNAVVGFHSFHSKIIRSHQKGLSASSTNSIGLTNAIEESFSHEKLETINPLMTVRKLGGYERLLSRKTPGTDALSLSHGCLVKLSGFVDHNLLLDSIQMSMKKHPMLRTLLCNKNEWVLHRDDNTDTLCKKLVTTITAESNDYDAIVNTELDASLNNLVLPDDCPQWKLVNVINIKDNISSWIFSFNHGIDDQQSVNILIKDIMFYLNYPKTSTVSSITFPLSVEQAVSPGLPNLKTIAWSLFQLYNSLSFPIMVPRSLRNLNKKSSTDVSSYLDPNQRRTIVELFSLDAEMTKSLVNGCKSQGVSVTYAVAAAVLLATSLLVQDTRNNVSELDDVKLRFLLSASLRPYGVYHSKKDYTENTVACAGGAIDFNIDVPGETCASILSSSSKESENGKKFDTDKSFWKIAEQCQSSAKTIIDFGLVPESTRLFGIGMNLLDILRVVEIEAANPSSLGRGYSCGVSSVGIVDFQESTCANGATIRVDNVYYGTSHSRNGVLCLLSCMTIKEIFCGCIQFPYPIVDKVKAKQAKSHIVSILESITSYES